MIPISGQWHLLLNWEQRGGKRFYKEGWKWGIRQVSEEHISRARKWLNAHNLPSGSHGSEFSGQSSCMWHFGKAATVCLLKDMVCHNCLCFSCWPPQQHYRGLQCKPFPLVCLKLLPNKCNWGFSQFLPSHMGRTGAKLKSLILFRKVTPYLWLVCFPPLSLFQHQLPKCFPALRYNRLHCSKVM